MDKREAATILASKLAEYRRRTYAELKRLLNNQDCFEIVGDSGTTYQLEYQAVWNDQPNGNLRVSRTIDDGGLRAFFPLTDSFIITHDGTFVGE